ncbi:hypothetical protein ACJMK2_007781 [Sinanodonta woodiana]|uniref:Uncharacterized protein n=1 Tax=Sinanodonta woodiana TaxID=1069815 RepID=A0ABD3VM17_SINWO
MYHLSSLKGTPLECRIATNIPKVSTPLGDVQIGSILSYQTKYLRETKQITQDCDNTSMTRASPICLPDEFKPLNQNTKCTDPCDTEVQTRNQALSDHWFQERKNRLTSSNFGKVLSRKSKPSEKLMNSLFSRNAVKAKPLEYGKRHEKIAKEKYLELYPSRHLHECGFVVNNDFSFLGASPDGKLCDNGVCGNSGNKMPLLCKKHDGMQ